MVRNISHSDGLIVIAVFLYRGRIAHVITLQSFEASTFAAVLVGVFFASSSDEDSSSEDSDSVSAFVLVTSFFVSA